MKIREVKYCPTCGAVAYRHGTRFVKDTQQFIARYKCLNPQCSTHTFSDNALIIEHRCAVCNGSGRTITIVTASD